MKITIKHYFRFHNAINQEMNLLSQEGWDTVRCEMGNPSFSIPTKRDDYIEKASVSYRKEALDLIQILKDYGFLSIFSVGSGCAYLEYNVKKSYPEIKITATDFGPNTVKALKKVFRECDEIMEFNIKKDDCFFDDKMLYLFFRIDTELSDKEWRTTYQKMFESNIEYILVVATELLTLERWFKELIKGIIKNVKGYTFCGYIRTEDQLKSLWNEYYSIDKEFKINNLYAYLLKINSK